ncbi:MAG: hypothetical protein AMJ93_06930 [Anaerolineae bacterium SM23_84]|nr:MAG: hypothetical protein AMJ93_06930 [Anaerolineae bacterium SM23_84]
MGSSLSPELDREALNRAITRGITFLHRNQLPHGEFKTYASSDEKMEADCRFDSSPFVTSLALYAIGFLRHPKVQEMTERGLDFLLSEMEGPGLWRYWSSRNPQHESLQPDLDVICCASHILKRNGRAFPSNTAIVLASRNNRGLFYTYVAPRPSTPPGLRQEMGRLVSAESLLVLLAAGMLHEIDCVVNANVLLYLGENEHTQAAVEYLIDIVQRNKETDCSKYYRDPLAFYYMLSRATFSGVSSLGRAREAVLKRIIVGQDGHSGFDTALAAALTACSLLNFNHWASPLPETVATIQQTQRQDGSWRKSPLYLGPAPYYGSEELTTALCVEALARYLQRIEG